MRSSIRLGTMTRENIETIAMSEGMMPMKRQNAVRVVLADDHYVVRSGIRALLDTMRTRIWLRRPYSRFSP